MSSADFLLIRPVEITEAMLNSTTVIESPPAAYNSATTYGLGDDVYTTTGSAGAVLNVWNSLASGNLNHIPSAATAYWEYLGDTYTIYAATSNYALGDVVIETAAHHEYESLASANLANALSDATKWLDRGATNRWSPFDKVYASQAEQPDSMTYVVAPGQIINTLMALNIDGLTLSVSQSISGYSSTVNLNSHPVDNWYDWYYEDLLQKRDIAFTGIPPYASGVLTITISSPGGTVRAGVLLLGKQRKIGTTKTDLTRTINDYSKTAEDQFGAVTLVQGDSSKRLNVEVKITAGMESEVTRLLEEYRATEMGFIACDDEAMALIYGFLGPWEVPKSETGKNASITIKGLI